MTEAITDPVMVQSAYLSGGNREEILKQIFGDVGELIEDFTCAVESTVLLHGRMYITNRFICFYSNLFGLEKKIRIPYSHIKNITKESTAYMIPNAISISTEKRDYLFRSFWDREDCFRILTAFWEKYKLGGSASISSSRLRVNAQPSPVLSPTPSTTSFASNNGNNNGSSNAADTAETTNRPDVPNRRATIRRPSTLNGITGEAEDEMDAESGFRSDRSQSQTATDTLSTEEQISQFNAEVIKSKLKHMVISGTFDIGLNDFVNLFIGENAPYSYQRYHESVKDTNVVASSWSAMSEYGAGREIKFFKPVNLPGLASTRGVKLQRYRRFGDYGLMIFSSTRLEDVPAADAFSVDDILCVNVVGENKINVEITFQVTFLKSTYMKYIIERSTNVEMMKWLEVFFNHLKKISEQFNKGEITLESAEQLAIEESKPVVIPVEEEKKVEAPVVAAPVVVEQPKTLLSHAYLSWGVAVVLLLYILLNQWRWSVTSTQIASLQAKISALEAALANANI